MCETEQPVSGSSLSHTELSKVHLARALIMNPEILLLQRPFSHHDDTEESKKVLRAIKEHNRNRGIGLPPEQKSQRRPRSVFYTPENDEQAKEADCIWKLSDMQQQAPGGPGVDQFL